MTPFPPPPLFGQYGQINHETTRNSQKLKTYSAPTVGNKVCDIGGHHRAITNRADTVSHHRLIVRQWLLYDMLRNGIRRSTKNGCLHQNHKYNSNDYDTLISIYHQDLKPIKSILNQYVLTSNIYRSMKPMGHNFELLL